MEEVQTYELFLHVFLRMTNMIEFQNNLRRKLKEQGRKKFYGKKEKGRNNFCVQFYREKINHFLIFVNKSI
jgi:hypothetical protein